VERFLRLDDERANEHRRFTDSSLWWQFESVLPITLTKWAKHAAHRIDDWEHVWGAYRTHYPKSPE
jgi:hypothetical protein